MSSFPPMNPNANPQPIKIKGKRGRPRINRSVQSQTERRREQVRLAQRTYRLKKETTISSLQKQVTLLEAILNGVSTLFQELYESGVEIAVKEGKNDLMQIFAFAGIKFERLLALANPESTNSNDDLDIQSVLKFTKNDRSSSVDNPSTVSFTTAEGTSAGASPLEGNSTTHLPGGQSVDRNQNSYGELESTCLINPENGFIPDFPQDLIKEHETELSFNSANTLKPHSNGGGSSSNNNTNSSPIYSSDSSTTHFQHSMASNIGMTTTIEDDFRLKLNFSKSGMPTSFGFDSFSHQPLHDTLGDTILLSNHENHPTLPVPPHVSLPLILPNEKVEQLKRDAIEVLTGKVKPAVPIEKLEHPISERIFRRCLMYLLDYFVSNNVKRLEKIFSGDFNKVGLDNVSKSMTALRLGISYNLSNWAGRIDDDNAFPGHLSPVGIEKYYQKVLQTHQRLDETKFIELVSQQARCLGNVPRISLADVQSAIVLSMV